MSEQIQPAQLSVKEAERKAWRSVFQDGLWDIYLGLLLLAMAVSTLLDETNLTEAWRIVLYISVMVFAMLVLWAGKRFITRPRLGMVKFGKKGQSRRKKARLLLFASVAFGLLAFMVATLLYTGEITADLPWDLIMAATYALNMLIVFGLGAYFLDYTRLYFIAVLFALPVPVDYLVRRLTGYSLVFWHFAIPAAIIIGMGLYYLIRFIREYPVADVPERIAENGC